MKFSEVTGQEELKGKLAGMVKQGRVAHALMFTGLPGYGGLPLALAMATCLSCEDRTETDSCGVCPSCVKYSRLIHPDLHFVFPFGKRKKEDRKEEKEEEWKEKAAKETGCDDYLPEWREQVLSSACFNLSQWYEKMGMETQQGIITVAESARIIRKLGLKSFESAYKVVIIWYPEKMNPQAANKLLKLLEEPPPMTVFILVAEDPGQMLPTIVSRTQIFRLSRIDDSSLKETLAKKYQIGEAEIQEVVRLAKGDIIRAEEIIRSGEESHLFFEMFRDLMRLAFKGDIRGVTEWIDKMAPLGREKQKEFLAYGLRMLRENFLQGLMPENTMQMVFMNREESEFSEKFSAFIHSGNIEPIALEFNEGIRHIEANAYARTVFLDLSLRLMDLIRLQK